MIARLRRRHRIVATGLLSLPLAAGAALWSRPNPPTEGLRGSGAAGLGPGLIRTEGESGLQTGFWSEDGRRFVRARVPGSWRVPDLLVYWSATSAGVTKGLPADAVLLGSPSTLAAGVPLPDEARSLVFFGLARGEVATTVEVPEPRPEGER